MSSLPQSQTFVRKSVGVITETCRAISTLLLVRLLNTNKPQTNRKLNVRARTMAKDYTVLFIGDYFSLVGDVTTEETDGEKIAEEYFTFMQEYYGWDNLRQVTKQVIVRDSDGGRNMGGLK